ncbi:MAG: radical SAM protein, partial [Vampirovibrionia bacterium]
ISGSGEPTLNSDIGAIINQLKAKTGIPIVVITNSSLLWMPEVREEIANADVVMPSIDTISNLSWNKVNRPAEGISIDKINEGLKTFTETFKGKIWLEVMLVEGVNDDLNEIKQIAAFVNQLKVDKVQINTVVRPPNENYAKPLSQELLNKIVTYFDHETEVIAPFSKEGNISGVEDKPKLIIDTLTRRPCRPQELADSLGINLNELSKLLQKLEASKDIMRLESGFYSLYH